MSWLVTGGAGYIGGHLVRAMRAAGTDVVVVDDFSTGQAKRLAPGVPVEQGSLVDEAVRERIFSAYTITGVVHLAAKKRVDESVAQPSVYYRENIEGLRLLLDACVAVDVRHFLFSSSAAVYGETDAHPINEDTHCRPVSPYGQTKLAGEWLVHAVGSASGMSTLALRYFNVAGTVASELADQHGMNLVPRVLRAIRSGEPPVIFGADYPTPDGTCVRDYIHVSDVADAHIAAARSLESGSVKGSRSLNIGTGTGVSVREMVDAALRVTASHLRPVIGPRRAGDPPAVVAAVDQASDVLQWTARLGVDDMLKSAWLAQAGA